MDANEVGEEEQPGPVLSLVGAVPFDRVILFPTPSAQKHTSSTRDVLQCLYPDTEIEVRNLLLADPTDYVAILRGLRTHLREIHESTSDATYYVAVASGTPQMHAYWVLLVASGEITARILHVRPPRFVTKDSPLVSEVDLTSPEFPVVRSNICSIDVPDTPAPDLETALKRVGIVGDHPAMRKALEYGAALAPFGRAHSYTW
jgi:hypothetical protein